MISMGKKKRIGIWTKRQCHYCKFQGRDEEETKRHEERLHGYFRDAEFRNKARYGAEKIGPDVEIKDSDKVMLGNMISLDGNPIPVSYEWNGKDFDIFAYIMGHKFPVEYYEDIQMSPDHPDFVNQFKFRIKGWEEKHEMLLEELKEGANGLKLG